MAEKGRVNPITKQTKNAQKVKCEVSPDWANQAVNMTSTSLEVSFDQLRELYQTLLDVQGKMGQDLKDSITITLRPKLSADVDSRSIADQDRTKKVWEEQIATGDVSLFPKAPEIKKSISAFDISEFKSEVESGSIDTLATKQHWEQKVAELKEIENQKSATLPRSISLDSNLKSQRNNNIYNNNNNKKTESSIVQEDDEYESAIDREIRLAQAREEEVKREHSQNNRHHQSSESSEYSKDSETEKTDEMPIYKVPPPVRVLSSPPTISVVSDVNYSPPSSNVQDTSRGGKESIIDREIREQQKREDMLKKESKLGPTHYNKEHEQSEYERREKEQERVLAHESIIEREIRLQRERDVEIQRLRKIVYNQGREQKHSTSESVDSGVDLTHAQAQQRLNELTANSVGPNGAAGPRIEPAFNTRVLETMSYAEANGGPDGGPVTYEEAISTYAHRGESLIAKELREQKEREVELRKRWLEMGLESPLDPSECDTPFNRPDPPTPKGSLAATTRKVLSGEPIHGTVYGIRPTETNHQASESTVKASVHHIPVDADEESLDGYRYVPRNETPIEREIRLAREREEELRMQKGLIGGFDETDKEVRLEVRGGGPTRRPQMLYRKGEDQDERGTMKRLATSRLQHEIEEEKRREVTLQKEGKISTISEQRTSDPRSYKDELKSPVAQPAHKAATYMRSPSLPIPQRQVREEPVRKASPHIVANGGVVHHHQQPSRTTPEPASRKVVVTKQAAPVKHGNQAEAKIEQELREMREREDELRRLHGMLGQSGPANGEDLVDSSSQSEVRLRGNIPGDSSAKTPRRKSTLAEQWEKRMAQNS